MTRWIFLFMGFFFLLFPMIAGQNSKDKQKSVIQQYETVMRKKSEEEKKELMTKASEYEGLEDYLSKLDPLKTGVMGWIEIPEINCMLPIYHGTEAENLEKGVGHLYGSDFPVGGKDSHCILCGHRGLPKAELFQYLNRINEGDYFYLHICGEVLTYQVNRIYTINPNETNQLENCEGNDVVSLITCTPYGINTRRLIVRGERIWDK